MVNKKAPKNTAASGKYTARYVATVSRVQVSYFHDNARIAKSKVPKTNLAALGKQLQSMTPPKLKKPAVNQPERDRETGKITRGVAQDTNKNNTAGRPTEYDDKFCSEIIEFFSGSHYEKVLFKEKIRETKQGKTEEREWKLVANPLPYLEAFARNIGVTYQTLRNWATTKNEAGELVHPEFAEAYATAQQLQKEHLVDNGLVGNYPPASFIFVAKNITDMKDTKNIELDKKADEEDIDDAELEEALSD